MSAVRPISERLNGVRILIVAPSLNIMGGQAVQADLLLRNFRREDVAADFQPHDPVPWWPLNYLTRIKYLRTVIVSVFYLGGLLRRIPRHDVIHVFSASYLSFLLAPAPAILIAKLFGKRCILNYRSGEADDHLTRWRRSCHWIIRKADLIVVPSGYLVEIFGRHGFRAEAIFNISDFNIFKFRDRASVAPRVLVARNLEPLYDIETALRAFARFRDRYPQATIKIVGSGSDERRLRRLVADERIAGVTFTGRVEREAMARLFDEADIFLNASVIDNMPVAIIEAFYCGLPVVTTNAGGIPYVVRDRENGLLCAMRDDDALAQALVTVMEDSQLRAAIIAGGRADAARFSWEQVREQWAGVYLKVLGRT